ncbi:hypothetical protein IVB30_02800 [Bradyrhizobium sp. 200]|uniref:hypothetical protein n=1 Tax=Bradyrhizobium sp. 200 TaxID=2782665 RepID=UPI001FFF55EE|nr:hypothetical protein [Bradyrhizobium sp. 200]UPJ50379.1 hypothetical protein IVB30_02800 [Bradyrhizobium sp. 200]
MNTLDHMRAVSHALSNTLLLYMRRACITLSLFALMMLTARSSLAWTGPTQPPPNGNVSPPINTSSSGQVKAGDFATLGKLGIGTASPSASYKLNIESGANWTAYFHNDFGGISFGPGNASWTHIYTDNAAMPFIFNTDVFTTTNSFSSYNGDLYLKTSSGNNVGTTHLQISNASGATIINGGSSTNWAQLNIAGSPGATASINAAGAIYSYDKICVGNSLGLCTGAGGTTMLSTGVRFPDGTTQTTAAAGNANPAWASITGKPYPVNGQTWNWSGQGGQPTWLWGSNDGTNMYVWNPSNFNVASVGGYGAEGLLKYDTWGRGSTYYGSNGDIYMPWAGKWLSQYLAASGMLGGRFMGGTGLQGQFAECPSGSLMYGVFPMSNDGSAQISQIYVECQWIN